MISEFEHVSLAEKSRIEGEKKYVELLIRHGIDFATGVPCSVQKHIIEQLSFSSEILHIPAVRESEAIGIAAGAYLAGKRPIVYMQNSGLLECINDISSLMISYKIPALLSVSWRGAPGEDAPQHFINGAITPQLLYFLGVPFLILEKDNLEFVIENALFEIQKNEKPAAILIRRGLFK